MTDVKWVATVSDGSTVVEHTGEYSVIPGQRKPWVRLTEDLLGKNQHLTSLRLNLRGRTIHLPRANFDRFNLGGLSRTPSFYSLAYLHEVEMSNSGANQTEFIDLVAHYDGYEVHYIQDITDGNNSWITVTQGYEPLAATPKMD